MNQSRLRIVGVLLTGAFVSVSDAQEVRGIVRDSATALPIAGAVASTIDSAGSTLSRTLSGIDGRFVLALSRQSAGVRLIRIGYQPSEISLQTNVRETNLQVAMIRLPAMLNGVTVSEQELCPASTDRGVAFRLWTDARAGLLAATVAREASHARVTTLTFQQEMEPRDGRIQQQDMRAKTGVMTRPFEAAAPASTFADAGYMREDSSGRLFFSPDADVLLDPSFAATHCFHLEKSDRVHAAEVGLAFTPIHGRDSLVDVTGVIWMSVAKSELRSLDFRYTGLEPAAIAAGAGGLLTFSTMSNGVVFVTDWLIRLPAMSPMLDGPSSIRQTSANVRREDRHDLRVTEIFERGGTVIGASWRDGTEWDARSTGVAGSIVERGRSSGVPNAVVMLQGTADSATTDANGSFRMAPVVPGKYVLVVTDTALAAFVAQRSVSRPIEIMRDSVANWRVELPPLTTVLAGVCADEKERGHSAVLVGRVNLSGGQLMHATVRAEWQTDYNHGSLIDVTTTGSGSSSAPGAVTTLTQSVNLDETGRFTICGVATERPIHLRFVQGESFADTVVFAKDSVVKFVDWKAAAHVPIGAAALSVTYRGVVLSGVSNLPITGADVWLPGLDKRARTDSAGAFRFDELPTGLQIVQIRNVGSVPMRDTVTINAGATIVRRYLLMSGGPQLDTVKTVAAGERFLSPQLRGFERRRNDGNGGQFVSDSVLRANESLTLSSIVGGRMSGLEWAVGQHAFASTRRQCRGAELLHACTSPDCYAAVYMDGVQLYSSAASKPGNAPPDLSRINTSELAGIEFYPSDAAAPPGMALNDGGCGSLWIWTREK